VKGKLHYMSPEQMAGDRLDSRADVFAVGAMLWDALAGSKLWEGLKGLDIMTALAKGEIQTPRSMNPNIAEELERICMRALAVSPDDRYPDAASFRVDLERAIGADPMPTSDIAAALAAEFGEERQHVRSLIAEQLQSVEQANAGAIPSLASQTLPPFANSAADKTRQTPNALSVQTEEQASDTPAPFGRKRRFSRGTYALLTICATGAVVGIGAWLSWGSGATSPTPAPEWTATRGVASAATTAEMSAHPTASAAPTEPEGSMLAAADARTRARATRGRNGHSHGTTPAAAAALSLGLRDTTPPSDRNTDGMLAPPSAASDPAPRPSTVEVGTTPAPVQSMPPAPVVAPPAATTGAIAADRVRAVVRSHAGEIQRCFERAQMDQLYFSARIAMSATVAPDGQVTRVSTSSSREGTARVQACIQTAVQSWTFPPPAGGAATQVSYTFVFE
jgi:eukaryotic-like serine/threonine-protein kinase